MTLSPYTPALPGTCIRKHINRSVGKMCQRLHQKDERKHSGVPPYQFSPWRALPILLADMIISLSQLRKVRLRALHGYRSKVSNAEGSQELLGIRSVLREKYLPVWGGSLQGIPQSTPDLSIEPLTKQLGEEWISQLERGGGGRSVPRPSEAFFIWSQGV